MIDAADASCISASARAKRRGVAVALALLAGCSARGASFRVTCPGPEPCSGRVVVYAAAQEPSADSDPDAGPFLDDADFSFGLDVLELMPSASVVLEDDAAAFPRAPRELPAGAYRAQAALVRRHEHSDWQREPGNRYSPIAPFEVGRLRRGVVELTLSELVPPREVPRVAGIELFTLPSPRLSAFRGQPVALRAGVVFPRDYDPDRRYPVVYEVPSFGGDAFDAFHRHAASDGPAEELSRRAFHVVLDPESGNGHTLFVNSDNNGPWGDALVQELIPALEKKYPLVARADARLLGGHSSGGWSVLWLQLAYPEVFGGAWASSPDPVDFRRFQNVDIYAAQNMYEEDGGRERPSLRDGTLSIRQENLIEEVLGPHGTSGQQWDSWQAAWGTRDAAGHVTPLYDTWSGAIDRAEAERYRRFDIGDRLARDPARYAPLFRQRIHLIVGTQDDAFLNEAVELLAERLAATGDPAPASAPSATPATADPPSPGYIEVLPGFDHHSIRHAPQCRAFPAQMLDVLRAAGL